MQAGKLDRRVSILRRGAPVDDGYTSNPETAALAVYATRWAAWKPATRAEQFENSGKEGKIGGVFHLRSDSLTRHITETDKVAHDGLVYDILGISEIDRRIGVELLVAGADGQTEIDLSGLSPVPDAATTYSGWAAYVHSGTQSLTANVSTALANNAATVIDSQLPADTGPLYSGGLVTGREGDSILITIELTFTPSDGTASNLRLGIDIGGAIGEIYPRDFAILQGEDVAHRISYSTGAYTLDTWDANGGTVKVLADGPGEIANVRYVIHRLHKAR